MKKHILITLVLMLISFFVGTMFSSLWRDHQKASLDKPPLAQLASLTGQTLMDLSLAIEAERKVKGSYPDSIKGLKVTLKDNKHSSEELLLHEAQYFKTKDGYVAFIGLPRVAFFHSQTGLNFQ